MTATPLHENGGIVLTTLDLSTTYSCVYSGDEHDYEYRVQIGIGYEQEDEIRFYAETLALQSVDPLIETLQELDIESTTPPVTLSETERIKLMRDTTAACLVCQKPITHERAIVFDAVEGHFNIAIHTDCIDSFTEALGGVWEHTGDIIADGI